MIWIVLIPLERAFFVLIAGIIGVALALVVHRVLRMIDHALLRAQEAQAGNQFDDITVFVQNPEQEEADRLADEVSDLGDLSWEESELVLAQMKKLGRKFFEDEQLEQIMHASPEGSPLERYVVELMSEPPTLPVARE